MSQDQSDLLDRRAQRLSALLRDTDPPVPPIAYPAERVARAARRRTTIRWRAAAAVALLALAAAGVPPVRAWIVQVVRSVWTAAVGAPPAPAVRPAAATKGAGAVTFNPAAGPFTLVVARAQSAGTLTIEITGGVTAGARVEGSGTAAELGVLPNGLRIVNDSGATASYAVRLPPTLTRVEVGIGGAAPRVLGPATPGRRWVLDLGAGR